MATTDEIERRVAEADAARSARRTAAAKRVGELAQRRAAVAEELRAIERELGDALATDSDVIDVDELAQFTDVPAAELTRWLTNRKPVRASTTRKRPVKSGKKGDTGPPPATAHAPVRDGRTSPATKPAIPSGAPAQVAGAADGT
ncbi:hypothetical protein [Amycolatopsis aidingensis]|uniref:hypothetical protein n=1 Tax=Amycolatopsis aidingensis TaxID=2842453 RepID=UPI001C0DE88D|nr:hypothetical protein [Amycolatopsis aidingensis]